MAASKLKTATKNTLSAARGPREKRVFIVTTWGRPQNPTHRGRLQKRRDLAVAPEKSAGANDYAPPAELAASGLKALRNVAPR